MSAQYRTGRHRANHVYRLVRHDGVATDDDVEIGAMFTDAAGILVVEALNAFTDPARPIVSTSDIVLATPREAYRYERRARGVEMANRVIRTVACQQGDPAAHQGCVGLRSDMNDGLGCLCECHDKHAQAVEHIRTGIGEATAP